MFQQNAIESWPFISNLNKYQPIATPNSFYAIPLDSQEDTHVTEKMVPNHQKKKFRMRSSQKCWNGSRNTLERGFATRTINQHMRWKQFSQFLNHKNGSLSNYFIGLMYFRLIYIPKYKRHNKSGMIFFIYNQK